ncbi:MAG: hypothetical protein ACFFDF_17645 [Candidatus Odinarchaeota archaeon]
MKNKIPEEIPESLAMERFDIHAIGSCECCMKKIARSKRGREGNGAWEAHNLLPDRSNVMVVNIRVVCSTGINCHLNCCHQGDYSNYPVWNPCNRYL